MNRSPEISALLARMEAARREMQHHLGLIERQIAKRAERMTITARAKRRGPGRSARAWTCVDECVYQAHLADLTLARLPEIERLGRGLARQDAALARMRGAMRFSRHRAFLSDQPDRDGIPLHASPPTSASRGTASDRQGVVHTLLAATETESGPVERRTAPSCRIFRHRQPGPHPVGPPLGFAAVCAPGGPFQGQVASDRRPPISARPGRGLRRAIAPLVRNRTSLAWRSPGLEPALIPAALGDRIRREARQVPDRTRRRNQERTSP